MRLMGINIQSVIDTPAMTNSRINPGIWVALLIALGLHGLILLLPLSVQKTDAKLTIRVHTRPYPIRLCPRCKR